MKTLNTLTFINLNHILMFDYSLLGRSMGRRHLCKQIITNSIPMILQSTCFNALLLLTYK